MFVEISANKPLTVEEFKDTIRGLRKLSKGFCPVNGYDLRKIKKLSDIHSSRRRRILRYWDTARIAQSQGLQPFRPRRKKRFKVLQEYSNIDYPRDFTVAFLEKRPGEKLVWKTVNKKPVVKGFINQYTGIGEVKYWFNKEELITRGKEYLKEFAKEHMLKKDLAVIMNGEFLMRGKPFNDNGLPGKVYSLMQEYGVDQVEDKTKRWERWLDGVSVVSGPSSRQINKFAADRSVAYTKFQKLRKETREVEKELRAAVERVKRRPTKRNKESLQLWVDRKVEAVKSVRKLNEEI